jgi:hypothetical protein
MKIRRYSELVKLKTFDERYEYLRLGGSVGKDTFGFERYLNQILYQTPIWKHIRNDVILRDDGKDLGIEDRSISGSIIVHHMNPITVEDVRNGSEEVFDPEFLICTSLMTHNAIHYGTSKLLVKDPVIRTPGDTCPWK